MRHGSQREAGGIDQVCIQDNSRRMGLRGQAQHCSAVCGPSGLGRLPVDNAYSVEVVN